MPWNPAQYLEFADARLRPALDLIARIQLDSPQTIVDLGCGTGNVSRLLSERWPQARIIGVDSSPAMLREARAATGGDPRFTFDTADLAEWQPDTPVDLVYSNAALHWLSDHAALFARVAAMVAPGGVLAVQMPDNFRAPSHTLIADIARTERWRATLGGIAEMCITAKVLQLGVPLVTAFHVARVVVILLTTVPVYARLQHRWESGGNQNAEGK